MDYKDYFPTTNLNLVNLIRECSLARISDEDLYYLFRLKNRENIHEVFRYQKFNNDFSNYLTVYNNGNNVVGKIGPSYEEFFYNLISILGVKDLDSIVDDDSLDDKFIERLYILGNITNIRELENEFPILYNDLEDGRAFFNRAENLKKKAFYSLDLYKEDIKYYYSCGLKRSIDNFIKTQVEMYSRYVSKRGEYRNYLKGISYGNTIRYYFDIDKVVMMCIHNYLCICQDTTNEDKIKFYLNLIYKYLDSSYKKSVSINSLEGVNVNIDSIMIRVKNIVKKLNHEGEVEWVLVPEGRDYSRVSSNNKSKKKRSVGLTDLEIYNLKVKGENKKRFYESTNYLVKAVGLLKYKGYIAYIYPNGEVLLDTEFHEDDIKSVMGDAIYNIKVEDFEVLSKLDKTHLRENDKVVRIIHSKNWQDRVSKIIDRVGSEEDMKNAKQLVKRLQNKRNS